MKTVALNAKYHDFITIKNELLAYLSALRPLPLLVNFKLNVNKCEELQICNQWILKRKIIIVIVRYQYLM